MKLITVISATGLAAGLAIGGVAVASATSSPSSPSSSSSTGITLPKGGVLEKKVTNFCERAPKLADRAEKAEKRLSGDASTKGSVAKVKAREAKASSKDHDRVAKHLGKVADRRAERLAKLPQRQENLAKAQTECALLP